MSRGVIHNNPGHNDWDYGSTITGWMHLPAADDAQAPAPGHPKKLPITGWLVDEGTDHERYVAGEAFPGGHTARAMVDLTDAQNAVRAASKCAAVAHESAQGHDVPFDAFGSDTLCANCGVRWGLHFGDMCHEEGPGSFAPATANEAKPPVQGSGS